MQFSPLKFQMPLAAGGIALMAFNYLQFAVPRANGMVTLNDMLAANMTMPQFVLNWFLVAMMLVFSVLNICFIPFFCVQWARWRRNRAVYEKFMADSPTVVVGSFIPFASLSMTACVALAPLAFFIPALSANIQAMMLPGLIFFGWLGISIFRLEFKVLKQLLTRPVDVAKLHFVWLLDVFSFGLVSLMGTGIAAMSKDMTIASIAAFGTFFTVTFGMLLLIAKLAYLLFLQFKSEELPGKNFRPAYFILVPISCLYGFSIHRIAVYMESYFAFDMKIILFASFMIPYVIAVGWSVFCVYLLWEYLTKDFIRSDFAAPQWSII